MIMYRIEKSAENEIIIEKSRFITYLYRISNEDEAKACLEKIRKLHPNATHHCYAFIIGESNQVQRSSDNGEPSGTAGVPILECLKKNRIVDILAIVVRYFGGIKLGAGGLIRAYTNSVSEAIGKAQLMELIKVHHYRLEFSYDFIGRLDYFLKTNSIGVIDKKYEELVTYEFYSKEALDSELSELSNGKYIPVLIKDEIVEMKKTPE